MASLDRESDAVVVRIVYDGPPTAGKTTSLHALAQRFGQGPVVTPEEAAGRTLYFDWLEYRGGRFDGREIRCQIISVPGQRSLASRRNLLLSSADAIVFVGDTTRRGLPESTSHLDELLRWLKELGGLPIGVVLQANKRDLPDAEPIERLRGERQLAVVESVASDGEGIREAFVFAVRLALDRVREQMRRGEFHALTPGQDPSGELLKQLRHVPIDPTSYQLLPSETMQSSAPGVSAAPPTPSAAPERAAAAAAEPVLLAVPREPRVPDAAVPGGWIWPPIHGRILLQEASTGPIGGVHELSPDEWLVEGAGGWKFHSSPRAVFTDAEEGRAALVEWAQLHTTAAPWISTQRCIALCATGSGTFRLWQIVRTGQSLWHRLTDVLERGSVAQITADFSAAATLCSRAALRWAAAPIELACTLETVAAVDGAAIFTSLMPEPGDARAPDPIDRRSKLWSQLRAMVNPEGKSGRK